MDHSDRSLLSDAAATGRGPTPTVLPTVALAVADGTVLHARPVHPDDKPLLADGFRRLSERTRYLRFLAPSDRLSGSQLAYLSEVDHRDHVAWGVLDESGAAAGIARWVRYPADRAAADVALTVVDDHQRRGIGRVLLQVLAVSARARGVGIFHFDVLAENTGMTRLLESMGAARTDGTEIVHWTLDVSSIPPPTVVSGDLIRILDGAPAA